MGNDLRKELATIFVRLYNIKCGNQHSLLYFTIYLYNIINYVIYIFYTEEGERVLYHAREAF